MNAPASLEDQLGDLRTSVRSDLNIVRRKENGQPTYVVHDPTSFATHTFSVDDYLVFGAIKPEHSLAEIFSSLEQAGKISADEKEDFYRFVLTLRKLNLLGHGGASGKDLHEQHLELEKAKRRGGVMKWLMPKIPLVNPDAFLERTIGYVGWLFHPLAGLVWLAIAAICISIVYSRIEEFSDQLGGILANGNLIFVWSSFIVVKIWHELGHGYACKRFGGSVPEMGTMVMMGTPLAYVDASSAWTFESKARRLVVMLGGMYFESMLSMAAVFIWALSDDPMMRSCAFQLVVMTSFTTVLFNANPLMRYDGYYVFTELVQIQNLRQIAGQLQKCFFKRLFLGVKTDFNEKLGFWSLLLVFFYGIASAIYLNMLTLSIAGMLAYALPTIGLGLAAYYILFNFGGKLRNLAVYLWSSQEVAGRKWWARTLCVLAFTALPAGLIFVPTPFRIRTHGVLTAEEEHLVRAKEEGIYDESLIELGKFVSISTPIARLQNFQLEHQTATTQAKLRQSRVEFDRSIAEGPTAMVQAREEYRRSSKEHADSIRRIADLTVSTEKQGNVAKLHIDSHSGRLVKRGDPIALILDGKPRIRTYLTEKELLHAIAKPGTKVVFSMVGQAHRTISGEILDVSVASEVEFQDLALTQLAGGDIVVDPQSNRVMSALYQITIDASDVAEDQNFHGRRVNVFLPRQYEPLGWFAYRKVVDFTHKLYVK
ncbi:MAG: hypothetical protein ACE361_07980 [Aureliella sp.]